MKKTVWVLSLIVMLLSQVFSPFAYAVSGEEVPIPEPVVEEPAAFDPRKYLTPARDLIKQTVQHKIRDVFGSSNKI